MFVICAQLIFCCKEKTDLCQNTAQAAMILHIRAMPTGKALTWDSTAFTAIIRHYANDYVEPIHFFINFAFLKAEEIEEGVKLLIC